MESLYQRQADVILSGMGDIGEGPFGVAALVNPRATINEVKPQSFRPGDRIDLAVAYTPANDEDSQWQTVVVVKEGTNVLVQERQKHLSMSPGKITANCDTDKTMPEANVYFTIEVWGHPDYLAGTWPY